MKKLLFILASSNILLANPSLDEMISQVIMISLNGTQDSDKWINQAKLDIRNNNISAFKFIKKNINNKEQITKLLESLKSQPSKYKTILAIDERGVLPHENGFESFLARPQIVSKYDIKEAQQIFKAQANEFNTLGFNLVMSDSIAPGHESSKFSPYEAMHTSYNVSFLESFKIKNTPIASGVFPAKNSLDWKYEDLFSFFSIIKQDLLPAIIVSNDTFDKLDHLPAVFSKKIIKDILIKEFGFEGLIISEDLLEDSIYSIEQKIIKAINSGVDILYFSSYFLKGTNTPKAVKSIITNAVKNKDIKEEDLLKAYKKVINFKSKFLF